MSGETLLGLFTTYGYAIVFAAIVLENAGSPLAGCARMPFARFLLFDGLGCLLWAGCFIIVGYLAGGHVGGAHERVRTLLALGLAGLGAAWLIVRLSRSLRWRRA